MLASGDILDLPDDDDDDGAIPSAASVTALKFSMSSRGSGVLSLTGLARRVREIRFAVAVLALMKIDIPGWCSSKCFNPRMKN